MSRKRLVAYIKKQEAKTQEVTRQPTHEVAHMETSPNHEVAELEGSPNHEATTPQDALATWMNKKIQDSIASMEQKRLANEWTPSTMELSKEYTDIVMKTLSRKEEIAKLMRSPI